MSDERRIADRVSPQSGLLSVVDRITETQLGTIANISETGFMLVTRRYIDVDSVFQLELTFNEKGKYENIQLGAVCLWCVDTSAESSYWAGFHIIDISQKTEELLKLAIADISN